MRVRLRLMINAWIISCAVILVVLSVAWLFYSFTKYGERGKLVSHMRSIALERTVLRDDYIFFRNERSAIQWKEKTEDLKKMLEKASSVFTEKDEREILKEARDHFNATENLFSQFIEYEKRKSFRTSNFDQKEEMLVTQVFLRAYSLRERLTRLYELTHHKLEATVKNGIIIMIIFFVVGGIGITINSVITSLTISKHIEVLEAGVGIIGQGNLEYKVDEKGDDEFKKLARSFNEMTAKLKVSYTSIKNLEEEIVARKKAEEELTKITSRQQALLSSIPDIVMEVDINKIYTWANEPGKEFFGEDVVGKSADLYFSHKQNKYDMVQPLFNGGENVIYVESWQRRKDGEERLLAWWCKVLKDDKGNVIGALSTARDITETRRAEDLLRLEKERFSILSENAPFGLLLISPDGRFIYMNPKFKEIFGYDLSEILDGRTWFRKAFPNPEYRKKAISIWIDDLKKHKKGEPRIRSFTVQSKDGAEKIINFIVTELESGTQIMSCEDITEHKLAQKALIDSEKKYRDLFENSVEGIFQSTPDGKWLALNPAIAKMHGYSSPEEMMAAITDIGKQLYVHPEDREFWKKLVIEHGIVENFEHQEYRKDGSIVWVSLSARAIKDDKGNVLYFTGNVMDITERKLAEEQLKEEQKKFSTLVEHTPISMILIERNGKFLYINPRFTELFGYTLMDVPDGRTWFRNAFPDPDYRHMVIATWIDDMKRFEIGQAVPRIFTITCKDGTEKIANIITITVRMDRQLHIVAFEDITERTKAEEKIRQQLDELQRWHNVTLGREMRILELKAEMNELCKRLGELPRYESTEEKT